MKKEDGFILFLNLMLISLIGLFIPLLIQQNQINYRITTQRALSSQYRAAAESGIEYLLYKLEDDSQLPINEEIALKKDLKIRVSVEEGDNNYRLSSISTGNSDYFIIEAVVEKDSLNIVEKIIRRSD